MPRYKLTIEYDGTGLAGWQRQDHMPSVQQYLEEAIHKFSGEEVATFVAGRTDAGVHAKGQVVHFDLARGKKLKEVRDGINFHIKPATISVLQAQEVSPEFHARFSAKKRFYRYRIINRVPKPVLERFYVWHIHENLNALAMQEAAQILVGTHDFTSFRATECQAKSPVKTIDEITITKMLEEITIDISAQSFLHHMVRNIVGTLRFVGNGKWTPEDMKKALEAKNRSAAGVTAPPHGLYFMRVEY
jgi:tRNA pseudouridine38-40 synthase